MEKVLCTKLGRLLSSPLCTCMCTHYSWVLILLCYLSAFLVSCVLQLLAVSSRALTPTRNHPVSEAPEGEGKCRGAKFSLGLFFGSVVEGALSLFMVGAAISHSRASGWHACQADGCWSAGKLGCNGLMGEQQNCPTFLYFKLFLLRGYIQWDERCRKC